MKLLFKVGDRQTVGDKVYEAHALKDQRNSCNGCAGFFGGKTNTLCFQLNLSKSCCIFGERNTYVIWKEDTTEGQKEDTTEGQKIAQAICDSLIERGAGAEVAELAVMYLLAEQEYRNPELSLKPEVWKQLLQTPDCLSFMFVWSRTPEGADYWMKQNLICEKGQQ